MNLRRYWHLRAQTVVAGTILLLTVIFVVTRYFSSHDDELPSKYYVPDAMVHDLENAEKRWAARTFSSYRMNIIWGECEQSIEVHNEKVVTTYINTCYRPGITISDLFAMIENDMTSIQWINGVGCDLEVIHPTYNKIWGYPERIDYSDEWGNRSNLNEQVYNKYVVPRTKMCTLLAIVKETLSIKSFIPLSIKTF